MICINNFNETCTIYLSYSNGIRRHQIKTVKAFLEVHTIKHNVYISIHTYKEMRRHYMNIALKVNLQVHTIKRNLYIYVHAYACIILKLVIITIIVFWVTVTFGSSHYMMVFIKRRVRYFFVIYFILVMF